VATTIHILAVGKNPSPLAETIERYQTLIRPYATLQIRHLKAAAGDDPKILIVKEAAALRSHVPPQAYSIALSAEGRTFESRRFAQWLGSLFAAGRPPAFILGGAYGLDPAFKGECREVLSLSPLTFSHQICMLVLVEQLYRACTILHNHPYHK
jgi:23S rRNA (pseudouridine1915-N3)-methyltransferase